MIIKSIEIKHFRSIKNATLNCDSLTALLGRNGAGKSSFLCALELFYNISLNITAEDFFAHDTSKDIEIKVEYSELTNEEMEEFRPYIQNNVLIVTKRIFYDGNRFNSKYYGVTLQVPDFVAIRRIDGKTDKKNAWNDFVRSGKFADLTETVRGADAIEGLMKDFEERHPELLQRFEREEQFFGATSIGGGKLDKYTKFVKIPAVRDANDELIGKKSSINQLIDMIVLRKVRSRKDIAEFTSEYNSKIKQLYCSENLNELPELGQKITKSLRKFVPDSELKLKWDQIEPPEIKLPTPLATLIEDEFEGDVSRKGHGLQRALIITLLQELALTEEVIDSSEQIESEIPPFLPSLILAIEEPELFLHPSRSRHLAKLFLDLITSSQNQIIYTTHSAYFVDIERFEQIRCVRKIIDSEYQIKQSAIKQYTKKEAAEKYERIDNGGKKYTEMSFIARSMPIMNVAVNEGFFANKILIVEGLSEAGVFWKLQEILKLDWNSKGISIIPAGGKNSIDRPVIIFSGLSIPTYFIFDGDYKVLSDDASKELKDELNNSKKKNHHYLKLANTDIVDFPESQACNNFAVFKECIEKEIINAITVEEYKRICEIVSKELGISAVLKNIMGASRFIELVYENKMQVPIFENILTKIEQMN